MFVPLRVTFVLDRAGVIYDPTEPPHLDGLLSAACARHHHQRLGGTPARDETPADIPLPLATWRHGGLWGWMASALLPDGDDPQPLSDVRYWRKRLRVDRLEWTAGAPNTTMGVYRDWQVPLTVLLVPRLVAYAVGDRRAVHRELLRHIRAVGRKRSMGYGRVLDIRVEAIPEDCSLHRDGFAMRWLPSKAGTRLVRPRPPYWSIVGRVRCCEVGDHVPTWATKVTPE